MKKTLIILIASILVLALVLWKQKSEVAERRSDEFAFDTSAAPSLAVLRVVKAADSASLEKKDGAWTVDPDGFPADSAKVAKVLANLVGLQTRELVSRSPDRLAEYGLDSAEGKSVTAETKDGKTFLQVLIGKTSGADFASTYWKYADKPEVYRTPGNFTWEVGTKANDWKQRKLFGVESKDIKMVTVDWKDSLGTDYRLKLESVDDTTWKLLEPQAADVKLQAAQDMINRFADLSIDDFVAEGDTNLAKSAIDTPYVTLQVETRDARTLSLSASQKVGYQRYAYHPVMNKTPVQLSSWRFEVFTKKPFEIIEPPKPELPPDSAAAPEASAAPTEAPPPQVPAGHGPDDGHGH